MSAALEALRRLPDVSRETLARLDIYHSLLLKWQTRINLVSAGTLPDAWNRHFLDSAQMLEPMRMRLGPGPFEILDFGSGAGFPGLVLACLDAGPVTLVESDQRKSAFLRTVIRETAVDAMVETGRIEALSPRKPQAITARALAPVGRLIGLAAPHLAADAELWLLKGQHVDEEIEEASKCWAFKTETFPSLSDSKGFIVRLNQIMRKGAP